MIYRPQLQTLTDTLRHNAAESPDRWAVRSTTGGALTFAQLVDNGAAVAAALRAAGLQPGDRIAYLGRESEKYYEVLAGAALSGTVLVPVNPNLTAAEVHHILADSGAALTFLDADHPVVAVSGGTEVLLGDAYLAWRTAAVPLTPTEYAPISPETPLAQLYTSGTTGLPKGVVLAHRSFFAIRNGLGDAGFDWIDWHPGDSAMIGIPGFHVGGLWYATQAWHAGATVISMPGFDAALARRTIADWRVSTAIFVPAMMQAILTGTNGATDDFASLRKVIYGGAPVSDTVLLACTELFDCDFAQIYGLTETGNTAICLPPDQHYPRSPRLTAAGRPYPNVRVRIMSDDGAELPAGQIGEVELLTPAAMLEYWNLPEATAETLVDGWIRTGDAGFLDEEGYLFIRDRKKDMILVGGENVYPVEIENALTAHPDVHEAAVIGIPDEYAGEAVLAYVVPAAGATVSTRELRKHLAGRLAAFKLPRKIVLTESIPRNPSGKILRRELREEHWAGHDRRVN